MSLNPSNHSVRNRWIIDQAMSRNQLLGLACKVMIIHSIRLNSSMAHKLLHLEEIQREECSRIHPCRFSIKNLGSNFPQKLETMQVALIQILKPNQPLAVKNQEPVASESLQSPMLQNSRAS